MLLGNLVNEAVVMMWICISSNFNWIHGDQDIPRSYIYIS